MKLRSVKIEAFPKRGGPTSADYHGSIEIQDKDGQPTTVVLSKENARRLAEVLSNYIPSCIPPDWSCEVYPDAPVEVPEDGTQD